MGAATRAHPSFGMTTTKTWRSVFSWHASVRFFALKVSKVNVCLAVSLSNCYIVNRGTWNNAIEITLSPFYCRLQDMFYSLSPKRCTQSKLWDQCNFALLFMVCSQCNIRYQLYTLIKFQRYNKVNLAALAFCATLAQTKRDYCQWDTVEDPLRG